MKKRDILAILTEDSFLDAHRRVLDEMNFSVTIVKTGADGLRAAGGRHWALVIVGFALTDLAGYDVCRELRRNPPTARVPIIVLGARDDETDIVTALELGADDYMTEPIADRILASRIRSLVTRSPHSSIGQLNIIEVQGIKINLGHRDVFVDNRRVPLTVTEFALLHLLAGNPGHTFTRSEILRSLRGESTLASERAVDVQIAGLRRHLGAFGNRIETVRGCGYRLRKH